ncbi:Protein of unknown function [Anaplasma phagocytophilum]|uniref:Uncharacterized protein n=1 Tax=Anaplasma phagocytophilum TaxID=948 RepID=A0A098EEA6_ANAPH|nr:Protein of unknown function [Anaplasma phagocytophilum]
MMTDGNSDAIMMPPLAKWV